MGFANRIGCSHESLRFRPCFFELGIKKRSPHFISSLFNALYTNFQNGRYLRCCPRPQQGPRGLHRQGRQHQLHDGVAAPRQQVSSSPVFRDSHPFPDFRGFLLPGRAANLRRSHRSERSRPRRLARFVLSPRLAKIYTRSSASAMSRASSLPQRDSDCDPAGRRLGCGLTWQS